MSYFTVRVELHDAVEKDYEALHEFMRVEGFMRTIRSDDGVEYHLPPAEYSKVVTDSIENVLGAATRAASKTRKKHAILVTEGSKRRWVGLEKV